MVTVKQILASGFTAYFINVLSSSYLLEFCSAVARYQILGGHTVNRGVGTEGAQHSASACIDRKKSKIGSLLQKSKIWKYFGRGKPFPTFFEA